MQDKNLYALIPYTGPDTETAAAAENADSAPDPPQWRRETVWSSDLNLDATELSDALASLGAIAVSVGAFLDRIDDMFLLACSDFAGANGMAEAVRALLEQMQQEGATVTRELPGLPARRRRWPLALRSMTIKQPPDLVRSWRPAYHKIL